MCGIKSGESVGHSVTWLRSHGAFVDKAVLKAGYALPNCGAPSTTTRLSDYATQR